MDRCHEFFIEYFRENFNVTRDVNDDLFKGRFCALSENGEGICNGDSGSPLVSKMTNGIDIFIGIVSWSFNCGNGYPDVFTSVYQHLDFIVHHMNR